MKFKFLLKEAIYLSKKRSNSLRVKFSVQLKSTLSITRIDLNQLDFMAILKYLPKF